MSMSTHAVLLFGAEVNLPPDRANALWDWLDGPEKPCRCLDIEVLGELNKPRRDGLVHMVLSLAGSRLALRADEHVSLDAVVLDAARRASFVDEFTESAAPLCAAHGLSLDPPGWHLVALHY